MTKTRGEILACALWVTALAFMGFGSLDAAREQHNTPLLAWGIFTALVAAVPTGWCIVEAGRERDDASVQDIIEVVDALHQGKRELTRLH